MSEGEVVVSRKDPSSILDLMLREYVQGEEEAKRGRGLEGLPAAEVELLLTNIKGLLLGGHGTTTDTLCFILMLLSKAPEVVSKLREEHNNVFGEDIDTTTDVLLKSPEKLQELPYTGAVIKEALRMFPVGFGVRQADPGATLTFDGRDLPIDGDQAIALNGHDLHYNARYFPNPTRFDPGRWLDPDKEIPRSYFRTFGRGPRACIGQNVAQNVLKVIVLMTIRDYDFSCAGLKPNAEPRVLHTDVDTVFGDIIFQEQGLGAKPRGGMMMTVRKTP